MAVALHAGVAAAGGAKSSAMRADALQWRHRPLPGWGQARQPIAGACLLAMQAGTPAFNHDAVYEGSGKALKLRICLSDAESV